MVSRTPGELDRAPCAPRKLFLEPSVLTLHARYSPSVSPILGPLPCTPLLSHQPQRLLTGQTIPGLDFAFHVRTGQAEVGSTGDVHLAKSRGKRGCVESPGDCDGVGVGGWKPGLCSEKKEQASLTHILLCSATVVPPMGLPSIRDFQMLLSRLWGLYLL